VTVSKEWRSLQREAQLAGEQVAMGVTVLGKANHAQTGLYSQAFFGISTGLERIGKLIVIADHAIQNIGRFPTNAELRKTKHDLRQILPMCEVIGNTLNPKRAYALRPVDPIHQGIEETLSEFAIKSRYYNLDYITGAAGQQTDPINMWWEKVAKPICARHYSERQMKKRSAEAEIVAEIFGAHTFVLHEGENGVGINDLGTFFARGGVTAVVQKYGRFYTLQIVRWLASILSDLSHYGGYEKRIEALAGLEEPFMIFRSDDRYLLGRKTYSIYKP
jgi:hypothetical protein